MLQTILDFICRENKIIEVLTLLVAIAALVVAFCIPRRIKVRQIFAELISSYRTPEMGGAILSIFHFYKYDCRKEVKNIEAEYIKKYNEQIGKRLDKGDIKVRLRAVRNGKKRLLVIPGNEIDFSKTLHFQRRLVAQFYFQMAILRYSYFPFIRISERDLKKWFTTGELDLLKLLIYLINPAKEVFINVGGIPEPEQVKDDVPMNKMIVRLYKEVKKWV